MEREDKITRLKSFVFLLSEVEHQLERLSRMKINELFPARMDSDGSKHTAARNDRMATAIVHRLEYENKLFDEIEQKMNEIDTITNAIYNIADPVEREVLRMRYMDGERNRQKPWREIAIDMYGDDDEKQMQMVFRIHRRAIDNLNFND